MPKYTKKTFINEIKENGFVKIEEDLFYVCLPCNTENFELSDLFEKQITSEGKYGYYVSALVYTREQKPYSQQNLPIYGDPNKYVTKWLFRNIEDVVTHDIKDRKVLKRANEYKSSLKELS